MKPPREWADEAVDDEWIGDDGLWAGSLGCVRFEPMYSADVAQADVNHARAAIGRLVECAQEDARAPLEKEIARLRAENERLRREATALTNEVLDLERIVKSEAR